MHNYNNNKENDVDFIKRLSKGTRKIVFCRKPPKTLLEVLQATNGIDTEDEPSDTHPYPFKIPYNI